LNLGQGGGQTTARLLHVLIALAVISLAPAILVMATSFTRLVVVLAFLRSALGLQQTPPNIVLISLALFLTGAIMAPTIEKAYVEGIAPLTQEKISEEAAWEKISHPFREFMLSQVREEDLKLFVEFAKEQPNSVKDVSLRVLMPAFIISELRRAFEIGFLIFLPFLVIDLVVAAILMSMGMMMLPPVLVSLPFKLVFFVLIDGWNLVTASLVRSFQ
ncbi:MAG: flagellar type III secretion system pore protein FliP, partial [Holosporales bacterium]|jgi:flagellar biosynthetic protein FliP|nr:flagellar type III secretion system pore protein FliP [Holosporales bacterium]